MNFCYICDRFILARLELSFCSVLPWAKSKLLQLAVKQPMQSKELHKKPIHFLFTKSTEAQTGKGDDKRIRLCFETEYLHQDCPGIHEKYSIIIKLLSIQLEENHYQFEVRFLPGLCLSAL